MVNNFLDKITVIIVANLSDERFGVSELANEIGMSRSNLLRKVKNSTNLSVSQLIRQIRLEKAMELLKGDALTVSEISYKVGFSSTSYFIKCFGDHYGYPPGEARKVDDSQHPGTNNDDESSRNHQLAAIMFTDIEGYTALMQQDERTALEFRNRHREVFETVSKKFQGRILQYYGDGTLSTFASAIDAVRCGIEMQLAFRQEPQIPVRIGIHTGDIIVTKDDIIGDGVNVASRIESLAAVGTVYISEKVYDEVKNQNGIQTVSMGVFELKNVAKPIEVYAITNPGLAVVDQKSGADAIVDESNKPNREAKAQGNRMATFSVLIFLSIVIVGYILYTTNFFGIISIPKTLSDQAISKKSIAVLPFINDSRDSTNIYFINGLMESTLNNLQKIGDLRVISRTSVEKYRNNPKSISEIAQELNVRYIVEGSGQKIGDQILLNIQLIDAQSDKHLWSEQYSRKATAIFNLQREIAKSITDEIEVFVTPEVEKMIDTPPTDNLVAYDHFLKGLDLLSKIDNYDYQASIGHFEKAIEEDPKFARAYAATAMAYYYLDRGQAEQKYADQINYYADQALLFDPELPQSLIAKALFFMHGGQYELAESYFEKALEYNPNYDLVFVFLIDLYVNYIPDTEKYLEYALRGLEIDISAYDSTIASLSYLHLSNAFIQSGFIDEAEIYINNSLAYQPTNLYSQYVRAYIVYARNRNLEQTKNLLVEVLRKDTMRLDVMQEVGKFYYFMQDYKNAYHYYRKFVDLKKAWNLDIYHSENAKISIVFANMGLSEEADELMTDFKNYADNDQSVYKDLSLAAYYSYLDEKEKSIEHLRRFSEQENYFYWILVFSEIDPMLENVKDLPEFVVIFNEIETKFWKGQEKIRANLEDKGLISRKK